MGYRYYRSSYNRNRYSAYNQIVQAETNGYTSEQLSDPKITDRITQAQQEQSLSTWEKDFLESIKQFFNSKKSLTSGQYRTFEKIEKRFDAVTVKDAEDWFNNYTQQMHDDVHLLARIYKNFNSPYFKQTVEKVLNNPEIKLSKSEYEKFAKTKYAEGYLNNVRCKPRFVVGDTVCPSSRYTRLNIKKFAAAIIIDNESELPHTYSDGGKRYVVLPYGETQTVVVNENELKYFKHK